MASIEKKVNGSVHDADEITSESVKAGIAIIANKTDESVGSKAPGSANQNGDAPEEPTKRSIRVETWRKIQDKDVSAYPNTVFNRIPNFIGAEKAAQLLADTQEFKDAKNIKVDMDRSLTAVKLQVINGSKNLYISPRKDSNAIFSKVNCSADEDIEIKSKAILVQHLGEYGTDFEFATPVELDLLIFGSVAVSKIGQRIGRGNGYVDLDFALLKHCGAVTNKTLIVTVVHDEQLYDTLPNNLFTNYDVPIDLIVTSTQVIRIDKRLPRPDGIQWNLLSERRLGIVPVLKVIKENEEKNGKIIVLKEEDTDVETNRKRKFFRRFPRYSRKSQGGENNDGGRGGRRMFKHRKQLRSANNTGEDGEQSSTEKKSNAKQTNEKSNEPAETTKRSIRVDTWKEISQNKCAVHPHLIYNRVPNFIGAEKAAELLADIDEFKNAKTIKVSSDKAQDPVKLKALDNSKELYVTPARDSNALYTKINCSSEAEDEIKNKAIRTQFLNEYGTDIELKDKVKLDLLVIGAVAVSKIGQLIGRGNGYVDLDFGILVEAGAVTEDTIIVATVHNKQVYDTLPDDLFQNYDVPVDIIVTPTEVIRIDNRRNRPMGVCWDLITERRMDIVPVLKPIKELQESLGKDITLKQEEPRLANRRYQRRNQDNRRFFRFRGRGRSFTDTNAKKNDEENAEDGQNKRSRRKYRKSKNSVTVTDGEQSSSEKKPSHGKNQRKRRDVRDFCIKVSNIPKTTRVKQFKTELRENGCNPMFITWKGSYRTCFLHFGKNARNGESLDEDTLINDMKNALDRLTLNDNNADANSKAPPRKLKVEIVKRNTNSESNENRNENEGGSSESSD